MNGLIINLAPTGMVPTKEANPNVPVTVEEIVVQVRHCVELGVNMLHLHARDEQGAPTYRREVYARLIGSIREHCPDVVICVSLSGRNFGEFEQRADPLGLPADLLPDMASLTLSSMNFNRVASVNSPDMIQRLAARMAEVGVKPELEVFDLGMLNAAHYLAERGLIQPPYYFNFILGNLFSAQAHPAHLGALMAGLPAGAYWVGGGIGADQFPMNAMGILHGHGARVGLEDTLWLDAGRCALASNPALVERVLTLTALFGKHVATAAELRSALGLPKKTLNP